MKNVEREVWKFKREYKIRGVPSLKTLQQIVQARNYKLQKYSESTYQIVQYEIKEKTRHVPAITCARNDERYIFYDDNLNERDLAWALAHEIGHIYLNHLAQNLYTKIQKDWEANSFALGLMRERRLFDIKHLFVIGLVALSFIIGQGTCKPNYVMDNSTMQPSSAVSVQNGKVYITSSGTVYHERTCFHIKGRKVIAISQGEAASIGRTPCKDCLD